MKSSLLSILLILFLTTAFAQSIVPASGVHNDFLNQVRGTSYLKDSIPNKKWSLNKYSGVTAGFTSWRGGFASTVSAPVGVQLNRMISNNVYAFGGVSIAPTYINFRQTFLNADFSKTASNNTFLRGNSAAILPRAELGLGYINDDRTFQIRGSMSVQRIPNDYFMLIAPSARWPNGNPSPVMR